jgi:hypothetical protein
MLLTWSVAVSTRWLVSVPRYVLAIFPMFTMFGLLSKRKIVNATLILVSFAALLLYGALLDVSMGILNSIPK